MIHGASTMSLRTAAVVAGLALLAMAIAAPFAELYVYPRLVIPGDPGRTAANLAAHRGLFAAGIMGYLLTFLCDVVAAWALYVLLRPVHESLSLLTAWFRLLYTAIGLMLLPSLLTALRLATSPDLAAVFGPQELHTHVALALSAFKKGWSFALVLFGIHLGLLGALVLRSTYIPKVLSVFLIAAGAGYVYTSLEPLLLPGSRLHLARYTFYGELIFMLWLLVRGGRIPAQSGGGA